MCNAMLEMKSGVSSTLLNILFSTLSVREHVSTNKPMKNREEPVQYFFSLNLDIGYGPNLRVVTGNKVH